MATMVLAGAQQGDAAAGDDAFFNGGAGGVQGVLDDDVRRPNATPASV